MIALEPSPLLLPSVTLCAVASVNVPATIAALVRSMKHVAFPDIILFTHEAISQPYPGIRIVAIQPINSVEEYSRFVLAELVHHVATDHCLIVQWDGFVIDASCWDEQFLQYDYIGAPWPQFTDGRDVGNGGFSLRSRRLMVSCAKLPLQGRIAEDVLVCREYRDRLESEGMQFAPRAIAARFAYEREKAADATFGFHGVFNMVDILGADAFWNLYKRLDRRASVYHDVATVCRSLNKAGSPHWRAVRLLADSIPFHVAKWGSRLSSWFADQRTHR